MLFIFYFYYPRLLNLVICYCSSTSWWLNPFLVGQCFVSMTDRALLFYWFFLSFSSCLYGWPSIFLQLILPLSLIVFASLFPLHNLYFAAFLFHMLYLYPHDFYPCPDPPSPLFPLPFFLFFTLSAFLVVANYLGPWSWQPWTLSDLAAYICSLSFYWLKRPGLLIVSALSEVVGAVGVQYLWKSRQCYWWSKYGLESLILCTQFCKFWLQSFFQWVQYISKFLQ